MTPQNSPETTTYQPMEERDQAGWQGSVMIGSLVLGAVGCVAPNFDTTERAGFIVAGAVSFVGALASLITRR